MSLIKQSLQANSAALKEPEQEVGAEHLPHGSEQKKNLVGKAYHLLDGRVIFNGTVLYIILKLRDMFSEIKFYTCLPLSFSENLYATYSVGFQMLICRGIVF